MPSLIPLKMLPLGQEALIQTVQLDEKLTIRLLELGFARGTKIKALHNGALGRVCAYGIRGTVIGLRLRDADQIFVLWDGEA